MTTQTAVAAKPDSTEDSAKRRQILDGARQVFLTQGFDAASMGEIARVAGVSKGTLYVYFQSKEQLFGAMAQVECHLQAESVFRLDLADHDVGAALKRLGTAYAEYLCDPRKTSAARTIMAIAERMPQVGREFYESGPAQGIRRLQDYLQAQVDAGVLAIDDCEVAAAQFLDSCQATMFKPFLFNFAEPPTPERIDHVVGIAVRTFMAAYRPR